VTYRQGGVVPIWWSNKRRPWKKRGGRKKGGKESGGGTFTSGEEEDFVETDSIRESAQSQP